MSSYTVIPAATMAHDDYLYDDDEWWETDDKSDQDGGSQIPAKRKRGRLRVKARGSS